MKSVVIGINTDFQDTFCLVPYAYLDCVSAAGALPLVIPCLQDRRALDYYLDMVDGLILIGGKDYPSRWFGQRPHPESVPVHPCRAKTDLFLARAALRRRLPTLGICAGHQLINIAMGGKIVQHIPDAARHRKHERATGQRKDAEHSIKISEGRMLSLLFGKKEIMVNSSHHQAIDPAALGAGLQAVAFADGGVIEAIEAGHLPFVLGLQWHPERMPWRSHASKIFNALVRAAKGEH